MYEFDNQIVKMCVLPVSIEYLHIQFIINAMITIFHSTYCKIKSLKYAVKFSLQFRIAYKSQNEIVRTENNKTKNKTLQK